LIDLDHFVDEFDAFDPVVRPRLVAGAVQRARQRLVQDSLTSVDLPDR